MSYILTISIVTYKTDIKLLKNALKNIQNKEDIYITIADNNSGEEYYNKITKSINGDNIRIISTGKNGGYGYGHNYAEKNCPDSKYHLIMNADINFDENCIHKMIQYMEEHKDTVLLAPKVVYPDGNIQYLNKRKPTVLDIILRRIVPNYLSKINIIKKRMDYYEMRDKDHDSIFNLDIASGCFMLLRRGVFQKANGFDEIYFMYFEDFDLSRKLSKYGKLVYYPKCKITHHWERGSKKNIYLFASLVRSACLYFNKWGWRIW